MINFFFSNDLNLEDWIVIPLLKDVDVYQLAGCDGHVLDASPWQRNAVQYLTRFPSVDTETVLCGTEQTLAFRMEINRSAKPTATISITIILINWYLTVP